MDRTCKNVVGKNVVGGSRWRMQNITRKGGDPEEGKLVPKRGNKATSRAILISLTADEERLCHVGEGNLQSRVRRRDMVEMCKGIW